MSKKECYMDGQTLGRKEILISDSLVGMASENSRRKLLLHSCCGPCSTSVIERLAEDYDVTVFYYNPCITDEPEYEKRKENQIKIIEAFNESNLISSKVLFIEGRYDPREYYDAVYGLESEPEGAKRCDVCFRIRMRETAKQAKLLSIPVFTTTLSVSPHKNYEKIRKIGKELESIFEVEFLDIDFKKKAGFQRSIELSKEYGLYRQDYCGCEYSKRKK